MARRKDDRPAQAGDRPEPAARPRPTAARATPVVKGMGAAPALVVPLQLGGITIDGAQLMIERDGLCSWFTPVE